MSDFDLDVQLFYLNTRTHPLKIVKEALRFRKAIDAYDSSIVHAHYGTVTALFAVCFSSRPVVITFRGSDLNPSSEFSKARGATSRFFSQLASLFASEIICVSEELRERLWWRRNRVHVILTGTNLREFYPIDRNDARQKLGWNTKERIVLFNHGHAKAPNKRLDLVEEAVGLLRPRLDSTRLVVMSGDVRPDIVPLYINAADVVVMTSDFEGSPNIVKEALACNVPVCSVLVGDVPQLLEGVNNCNLVNREPSAIADGLQNLIRSSLRSNGRDFADRFSAAKNTERVCDVLRRAARNTANS